MTYYYAWKGGPRLPRKPGDPQFIASYEAVAKKVQLPSGTLQAVMNAYQSSPKFTDLAFGPARTTFARSSRLNSNLATFLLPPLPDRRTRAEFLAWRDKLAIKSRRQADYTFSTFAAIMAWANDRGLILSNPCERPGKLYQSQRAESIWLSDDEAALKTVAPPYIWLAFLLAVWTGQRQGDLLRLLWTASDGHNIRLKQSKGGRRVNIPVGNELKIALDNAAQAKTAVTILTTTKGTPWTSDGFRTSWGKIVTKAKVSGLTFHDLRGTAVTRFAQKWLQRS